MLSSLLTTLFLLLVHATSASCEGEQVPITPTTTLSSICREHSLTLSHLLSLNAHIKTDADLIIGDVICISSVFDVVFQEWFQGGDVLGEQPVYFEQMKDNEIMDLFETQDEETKRLIMDGDGSAEKVEVCVQECKNDDTIKSSGKRQATRCAYCRKRARVSIKCQGCHNSYCIRHAGSHECSRRHTIEAEPDLTNANFIKVQDI